MVNPENPDPPNMEEKKESNGFWVKQYDVNVSNFALFHTLLFSFLSLVGYVRVWVGIYFFATPAMCVFALSILFSFFEVSTT